MLGPNGGKRSILGYSGFNSWKNDNIRSKEWSEKLRKVIPWIFWSNSQFGPTGQARIYN